jgi:uncharacterized membrane protein YgdD (TMEM256/DUF423 family)
MTDTIRRFLLLMSGIFGCAGVALAAASAHAGGDTHLLASASTMCLAHAPALLALYAGYRALRTAPLGGLLMAIGTLLFTADLLALYGRGTGLFPMAAPIGGFAMMGGWLVVAAGAFFRTERLTD